MKPFRLSRLAVLVGLAFGTLIPYSVGSAGVGAAPATRTLLPAAISVQQGSALGSLTSLKVRDQSGSQDTPSKYVLFITPSSINRGYRTYSLPTAILRGSLVSIQVEANFKGPAPAAQSWAWYLFDWSKPGWVRVGDDAGVIANLWQLLVFPKIASPARFVEVSSRQIRLLLISDNATGDAKLDYEALVVSYNPAATPAGASGFKSLPFFPSIAALSPFR